MTIVNDVVDRAEIMRRNRVSVLTDSAEGRELMKQIMDQQADVHNGFGATLIVNFHDRKWHVPSYSYPIGEILLEQIYRLADEKSIVISEKPCTVAECDGAAAAMTTAMKELFDRGLGPNQGASPWYYKDNVVVARDAGIIIGIIAYRFEKNEGSAWIMMGWVTESCRKQGIYRKLWEVVVKQLREAGAVRIEGTTHINNVAMRGFYNSVGRVETHVISSYKIPLE